MDGDGRLDFSSFLCSGTCQCYDKCSTRAALPVGFVCEATVAKGSNNLAVLART